MTLAVSHQKVNVLRPYLVYVVSFVGAGMVSGGVVHYPLNENYYGTLAMLGALVFALGALSNEVLTGNSLPKISKLISLVITSLLLSFGIGMLSGGIQHFTDFPTRAAILIPSGITLSFLAFCVKAKLFQKRAFKKLLIASFVVLSSALISLYVLTGVARNMGATNHTHETTTSSSNVPAEDHSKHPHTD